MIEWCFFERQPIDQGYWHRSLNPKKLIEVGFSHLGARMTMARTIKLYKVPSETDWWIWECVIFIKRFGMILGKNEVNRMQTDPKSLVQRSLYKMRGVFEMSFLWSHDAMMQVPEVPQLPGMREMKKEDVPRVHGLVVNYLRTSPPQDLSKWLVCRVKTASTVTESRNVLWRKFTLHPEFSPEEAGRIPSSEVRTDSIWTQETVLVDAGGALDVATTWRCVLLCASVPKASESCWLFLRKLVALLLRRERERWSDRRMLFLQPTFVHLRLFKGSLHKMWHIHLYIWI